MGFLSYLYCKWRKIPGTNAFINEKGVLDLNSFMSKGKYFLIPE